MYLNFYIEKILNVNITNYSNLKFYNNTIDLNIYTVFKIVKRSIFVLSADEHISVIL